MRVKYIAFIIIALFSSTTLLAKAPEVFNHTIDPASPSEKFSAVTTILQQVTILRGDFNQTKSIAVLRHPLVSDGRFILVKSRGLYWQIDNPVQIRFLMNDQGITQLDDSSEPSPPPAISQSLGSMFMAMISGDVKKLTDDFSLHFSGDINNWSMGLKPHSETFIDKAIEYIVLDGGKHIEKITIQENNGDITRLQLMSMQTTPSTLTDNEEGYFAVE